MLFTFTFLSEEELKIAKIEEPSDLKEKTEWRRNRETACLKMQSSLIEEITHRELNSGKRSNPIKNPSITVGALSARIEKLDSKDRISLGSCKVDNIV